MWDRELDTGKADTGKVAQGSRTAAHLFSLTLGAYLVAWVGLLVFTARTFGFGDAAMLSLVTLIPLAVGVRLSARWPRVQGNELVFLLVVAVVALVAICWSVNKSKKDSPEMIAMEKELAAAAAAAK